MKKTFLSLSLVLIALSGFFNAKKITWVSIGDSITYLNEHPEAADNRITKGYQTLVKEKMPNLVYDNQGYNGWTACNIADSINVLPLKKADIYTIFLGTNDWWHANPLGTLQDYKENKGSGTVYGAFRIITDKLRTLNKKARIILVTPLQRGDFVQVGNPHNNAWGSYREKEGQYLTQFADAVKMIGEADHLEVVDLYNKSGITLDRMVKYKRLKDPQTGEYKKFTYPAYTRIPFNPQTDEYPYPVDAIDLTYDGLHPSDKGYSLIADMILDIFKKKK
ncbi:SGNH/GDSL hydrolase family protein [Flavitalea flava]